MGGRAWHRRHQHAGCAERRSRRHDPGTPPANRPPASAGGALFARGQVAGKAVPAFAHAPRTHHPDLVAMARAVDVLVVIVPGGAGTKNMINAEVLKALGPNGILINVARGSVVDEPALIEALKSKTILSAGLDVFAEEPRVPQALIEMEHVVLLPHVGSASHHTRRAMGQLLVDNLASWAKGAGPLTPVPETPWPTKRK